MALAIASVTIGTVLAVVSEAGRRLTSAEQALVRTVSTRTIALAIGLDHGRVDPMAASNADDLTLIDLWVDTLVSDGDALVSRWNVKGAWIGTPVEETADTGFVVVDMWEE